MRANQKRPDSTRQSTGPTPEDRGRTGVGLSKRPVLLQTHPGTSAVKLGSRLDSSSSRAIERSDKPRGLTSFRPGRSTECVSSSQCQIVLARPLKALENSFSKGQPTGKPFFIEGRFRVPDSGGARRDRTDDLMLAKHALSQLSYGPIGVCGPPARGPSRQLGAAFAAGKA